MFQTPRARKSHTPTIRTPSRNRSEPGELLALEATLNKQMREAEGKHISLKKQHDKLYKTYVDLQAEVRAHKTSLEIAEKEVGSTKKLLAK